MMMADFIFSLSLIISRIYDYCFSFGIGVTDYKILFTRPASELSHTTRYIRVKFHAPLRFRFYLRHYTTSFLALGLCAHDSALIIMIASSSCCLIMEKRVKLY